jgi:cobalt/nickel transport system ATP-binding protein
MSHHIIEAQDLHYTYPDGTLGIKDVSFRITHGESVAMVISLRLKELCVLGIIR